MPQHELVWHAVIDGQRYGPISRAQVLDYLRDGTLGESDLVWRPGFEDWVPLREVHEFWTEPSAPERKQESVQPTLPQQRGILAKQLDEKWSLWGAATIGLVLSSLALLTSGLATRSYTLANVGYMPNAGLLGELTGELLGFPLLFVLIALIRNTVRRRTLRPSSVRIGWRVAIFFGILIAVGISLRIFGTLYFSRDEIITGDARDDLVKSFLSGCSKSQRAAAVSTGATESQINGYCNCLANSIASNLTYRQIGAGDFNANIRRAGEQAVSSCQAKQH